MSELSTTSDDDFSPADQAAFDAMRSGSPPPEAEPEPAAAPEPAPEAQPEPASQPKAEDGAEEPDDGAEDGADGEAEGNKGQYVRREALRQERERRKGLQKELAEAREARARLDERLRIFAEASQRAAPQPAQQAAPEEQVPNPEEDIFGYVKHLEKQLRETQTGIRESREQTAAREQGEQVLNSYKADAQRFAQAEPTFPDAYNHLYRSRAAELQYAGMTDPQAIMKAIAADEFQIAQQALRDGVSPAQRIYEIAKARGFAPKAPEPAADAAAAAKPVAETAAQKAQRAEAGQRGPGRSLSSVGGKPAGSMPTVEELANMSEDEFNRFAKTNPGAVTALMGG